MQLLPTAVTADCSTIDSLPVLNLQAAVVSTRSLGVYLLKMTDNRGSSLFKGWHFFVVTSLVVLLTASRCLQLVWPWVALRPSGAFGNEEIRRGRPVRLWFYRFTTRHYHRDAHSDPRPAVERSFRPPTVLLDESRQRRMRPLWCGHAATIEKGWTHCAERHDPDGQMLGCKVCKFQNRTKLIIIIIIIRRLVRLT